jgi:hypothetical protein
MSDLKNMNDGDVLLREIDAHAYQMALAEDGIERGFAHIGLMLLEAAEMEYWRVRHDTFREYLKVVAAKAKRSPGQLQQYFLTVRDLMDTFTPAEMETIGITKATKLRQAKDYALVLPQTLKTAALDPKISSKELKKLISETLKMPEDDGDYLDCEMEFMVTPEQRATIEQAIEVAKHTEPLTKSTISQSAQMLDVMMKLSQEFLGAHSGDGN